MCARYWKDLRPSLDVPTSLSEWGKYLEAVNASSPKGTSILKLLANLKFDGRPHLSLAETDEEQSEAEHVSEVLEGKKTPPLVIRPLNFASIDSAMSFMLHSPVIPLILFFDQSISQNNQEGGGHAVLLHSFDSKVQKKIYVIDALRTTLGKPYPWDMDMFNNGWREMSNLVMAVYPYEEKVSINMASRRIASSSLLDYMEPGV
jgi:hypothetical protein